VKLVARAQKDIYFPVLYLDKFLVRTDHTELRLFGFGGAFNPRDLYETANEREDHARVTLSEIEGLLEDYGFGTSDEV